MICLIVHAHGSAHRDDHIEAVPIGKGLTFVELDAMDRRSPLAKNVLVDPRRLAGDVLEDERSHLRSRCRPSSGGQRSGIFSSRPV